MRARRGGEMGGFGEGHIDNWTQSFGYAKALAQCAWVSAFLQPSWSSLPLTLQFPANLLCPPGTHPQRALARSNKQRGVSFAFCCCVFLCFFGPTQRSWKRREKNDSFLFATLLLFWFGFPSLWFRGWKESSAVDFRGCVSTASLQGGPPQRQWGIRSPAAGVAAVQRCTRRYRPPPRTTGAARG